MSQLLAISYLLLDAAYCANETYEFATVFTVSSFWHCVVTGSTTKYHCHYSFVGAVITATCGGRSFRPRVWIRVFIWGEDLLFSLFTR